MQGGGLILVGPLENSMAVQRQVSLGYYQSQLKIDHQGLGGPSVGLWFS